MIKNMMIRFNLKTFEPIPEGEQTLKIINAEARPSGKPTMINITWEDKSGRKTIDRYDLTKDAALTKLAILITTALNDKDMVEFDTNDLNKLIGKSLVCEVAHTKGSQPLENGDFKIFVNISKILRLSEETVTTVSDLPKVESPRQNVASDLDDLD